VVKVVRELLPALDNLERALAAAEGQPNGASTTWPRASASSRRRSSPAMARVGVEGYSPKGEVFDPNVHEAMAQQPVEGAESGTVAEVYQQGYRMDDTVIRPARVVVAQ
jgi:molecular chaperone GrpE